MIAGKEDCRSPAELGDRYARCPPQLVDCRLQAGKRPIEWRVRPEKLRQKLLRGPMPRRSCGQVLEDQPPIAARAEVDWLPLVEHLEAAQTAHLQNSRLHRTILRCEADRRTGNLSVSFHTTRSGRDSRLRCWELRSLQALNQYAKSF